MHRAPGQGALEAQAAGDARPTALADWMIGWHERRLLNLFTLKAFDKVFGRRATGTSDANRTTLTRSRVCYIERASASDGDTGRRLLRRPRTRKKQTPKT